MELSGQAAVFGVMAATGFLLGILFDGYRVLRGTARLKKWSTALADLLYWLIATAVVFGILLFSNGGELRLYVFIGLFAGAALYYRLASSFVIRLLLQGLRLTGAGVRYLKLLLFWLVVKPVAILFGALVFPFLFTGRRLAAAGRSAGRYCRGRRPWRFNKRPPEK